MLLILHRTAYGLRDAFVTPESISELLHCSQPNPERMVGTPKAKGVRSAVEIRRSPHGHMIDETSVSALS
jgi:hypothetical protein